MKFKNIHVIINPAAGVEEPILSYLNTAFKDTPIDWDVSITRKGNDAKEIASKLIGKTDLIAVYGGDGSVMEAAQALTGHHTPMAILPGGTANVMAKELGIPTETVAAIELLKSQNTLIKTIDTGIVNNMPFILRVNFGMMAEMVTQADRDLKDSLGQLAYGITAFQTLINPHPVMYKMIIDGHKINEEGVSLTVTNSGSIGISDYSFLPDISVTDGFFDVILLDDASITSILRVAGSTLLHSDSNVLKRWKCKEITISLDKPQKYICDDIEKEDKLIKIKVVPNSLKVLVPIPEIQTTGS